MSVLLLSPDNTPTEVELIQKANGFYGIRFIPFTSGSYFCQILDNNGVPTSVRPIEILVTEAEVSKTPRRMAAVSPRDRVAIRSHSDSAYRSPREQKVMKKKRTAQSSSEEEPVTSAPEQLSLEITTASGALLPGKAFQIPVIGEESGAYFVQFQTGFHSGIFSLQVYSQYGTPLFEERPLSLHIPKKFQIVLISLNLPLQADDLDLEITPLTQKHFHANEADAVSALTTTTTTSSTAATTSSQISKGGGTIENIAEGYLLVFFDDPTQSQQHYTSHVTNPTTKHNSDTRPFSKRTKPTKVAKFQLKYNDHQLFTDSYVILI